MILSDNETKVDLLNNEAIATTVINLLRKNVDRPVTIGVHGDWGAGKSSVLEMIEAGFEKEEDALCLKFNGWRFQGFEDAKIALIEGIVTGLVEKRPFLTKAAGALKGLFKRIDWLKVAKKAGGLALTAFTGIPNLEQIHALVGMAEGLLSDPSKLASKESLTAAVEMFKEAWKPGESKSVPEEIREFRKAFDELLKEAKIKQLVVLIDDLDRCLPEIAIETLEAVRLFVFTSRTAFVVAADEAMIEYAVRKHFPDLPDTTGPQSYARSYLEKLIQVPFRIPALGDTETRIYVTLLLVGADLGEESPEFDKLIKAARERLKRPWQGGSIDDAMIKSTLGKKAAQANDAVVLSEQIGPILATGTRGNPRQIKRFLNALLLRHRTAEARGIADDVKLPVLAKLMLAERFHPRLFDQVAGIAVSSANGLCEPLGRLETAAADGGAPAAAKPAPQELTKDDPKGPPKLEMVAQVETGPLAEWLSSDWIKAWARVKPSLTGVDLRPYLFVAKDRKDYFGSVSILGHLAAVVEQLLGPRMAVQGLEGELKLLAPAEAHKVFDALRGKIVSDGVFENEPAGVQGIMVLVKAHPLLQVRVVDLLEALPSDKLGPWAVAGWENVLRDAEVRGRFDQLVGVWSSSAKNALLKAAAANAQRLKKGGNTR